MTDDELRRAVNTALQCPVCGGRRRGAMALAAESGVSYRTLYRFLGGANISAHNRRHLIDWLRAH